MRSTPDQAVQIQNYGTSYGMMWRCGGLMCLTPDQAVQIQAHARDIAFCSWAGHSTVRQCLFQPKCINGYQ